MAPKSPYHTIKKNLEQAFKKVNSAKQNMTVAERVYNEYGDTDKAVACTGLRLACKELEEAIQEFGDNLL